MLVVKDNKLTTVIIWVSTIIIFLLLALLALLAGVLYSKQKAGGEVQVNILPGVTAEKRQEMTPEPAPAAPARAEAPSQGGQKIYVLINGKLVPLAVDDINRLAQEDRDMQQAQQAAMKAREQAARVTAIDEQAAQRVVAHRAAAGEVRAADGNKVVLTQAKYGRGLQSQLQLMGMAAADLMAKQGVLPEENPALEQKKKVRYIRVKEGDSLWSIAVRAYGNGFAYKRILEANPQIRNPDNLTVGMLLKVP